MHRSRPWEVNPVLIALVAVSLIAAASCRDSTSPPPPLHRQVYSLAGTYDVRAALDTFNFEYQHEDHCGPGFTGYCLLHRRDSSGFLSGTLTIDDTPHVRRFTVRRGGAVVGTDSSLSFSGLTGSFGGLFCDAIDYAALTGCTHVAPATPQSYTGTLVTDSGLPARRHFQIDVFAPPLGKSSSVAHIALAGTFDGDSLVGILDWTLWLGRGPPSYGGTFVAHRRTPANPAP